MQNYQENLAARVNGALQPLMGVSVLVTAANGLKASLYKDDGVSTVDNPITTDANGYFGFRAANGDYTLTFTGAQVATTMRSITLYDPDDDAPLTQAQAAAPSGASNLGYRPPTATASRTVENKLGESISVEDHQLVVEVDDALAWQRAVNRLSGKPGKIECTRPKYKIMSKVSCLAGQSFIGNGAELDVSEYDSVFLSYNEADVFSLVDPAQGAFHPPTLIEGFKVMGKISVSVPNRNFVFARINRTPFVTMRDCTLYYAAAAQVVDESILCTFDSVRCYNPVSDCLWFNCTDRVNRFAPNGCNVVNCWFEEQKYPCNGVRITAGIITIKGGYMESLSTLVKLDGGMATMIGVPMGLRYQANSIGVQITQPTTLKMIGCDITLAGGLNASNMTALSIGADTTLTFNDNLISAIHGSTETSTCFSVNAAVIGTMNGNTILSKVLAGKTTVFDIGNNSAFTYRGTCDGNHFEAQAGCGMDFNKANGGAGKLAATIQGRFVRVGSFAQMNASIIHGSTFDGAGSAISMNGGVVRNNSFLSTGWSVTGAGAEDSNFGLYSLGKQSKPMASAYLGAVTSIPNNAATKIIFDTEEYDTNAAHDAGTGKFQPNVPGYYQVNGLVSWYPAAAGVTQTFLYKNGASYMAGANNPDNTNGMSQVLNGYVYLNGTTDYLELYVRQTSGAALSVAGGNGMRGSFLQFAFLRGA